MFTKTSLFQTQSRMKLIADNYDEDHNHHQHLLHHRSVPTRVALQPPSLSTPNHRPLPPVDQVNLSTPTHTHTRSARLYSLKILYFILFPSRMMKREFGRDCGHLALSHCVPAISATTQPQCPGWVTWSNFF